VKSAGAAAPNSPVVPPSQIRPRTVGKRRQPRGHSEAERLRVALLCPVWFPVPPPRYGGIEAVVSLLAEALSGAGHEVTVFASGDSQTRATVSWTYAQAPSERIGEPLPELRHVLACYERASEFDVISDHTARSPLRSASSAQHQFCTRCTALSMASSVRSTNRSLASRRASG
jgi:hypothetical protein